MQFKLGKTPAREDAVKLKLSSYLLSAAVKTPATAGHYSLEQTWGMLGNDKYGDCVLAGGDHEHILWNKEGGKIVKFTDDTALADYSAITGFNKNDPNTDQGTDMQAAASYRLKTGLVDASGERHKIGAYVAITTGNETQLREGVYLFGSVAVGIQFPSSAMDQFNEGKPWDVVDGASIEGGHYVPAVGYDPHYVYVVTWGKVQKMTWAFFAKYCDEALVYLSTEFMKNGKSLEGFDLAQLQADLKSV